MIPNETRVQNSRCVYNRLCFFPFLVLLLNLNIKKKSFDMQTRGKTYVRHKQVNHRETRVEREEEKMREREKETALSV